MKPFFAQALLGLICLLPQGASANEAAAPKVFRYAIRIAETGFDPAQISDLYSRTIASGMYEAPLRFDFLARPIRLRPGTTVDLPEITADFKTLTFKLKPGIFFAPDPAFGGKKRELVAADYVYSIKRHYDPKVKSSNLYILEAAKIVGLSELRKEALASKKPFDYDREVAGLRALDRYTFQVHVENGDPRFVNYFGDVMLGAQAREVVEFYGDKIMEHPVGTGAWRLAEWRRSSLMVLEKNPNYRDEVYDLQPDPANTRMVAEAARLQGRKLPMIDRVEIAVVEENQPRWLAYLRKEFDIIEDLPPEYAPVAVPKGKLAPNLAKDGMLAVRYPRSDIFISYFNMDDPVVGGYTPEKVALRRAISLAYDTDKEVRIPRRGQAIVSQGPIPPTTFGYEPTLKTEMSEHNLARAQALLDLYGYVDRDGDGWRDQPDGRPLQIEYTTEPDGEKRQLAELWQKAMDALHVRIKFNYRKWPENLKSANAGKLQMWGVGWSATTPDGDTFLALGYGPNKGQANKSRFDLPAFNALYKQQKALPNGPERLALMTEAQKLMVAYTPYKLHVHRVFTDLSQPWVIGYDRNVYMRDFWKYIDIDLAAQQAARR
ncbi:ABC transporter substrate-binding protein [Paucibacter sp. APW11]|uniref:ABC transporter substrate-binding protein n=1 Tax=Roseateles aquae TaxID=3077235 RepID=A0ABU3PES4_9BURK|nr:ABC transporter substrate-binding protein [Paucibacter sp. APW11]MDT9001097.1 ABC transporter substrate-binding protein [Paucibacter sp. APW11]